jgi:hypothetical protein
MSTIRRPDSAAASRASGTTRTSSGGSRSAWNPGRVMTGATGGRLEPAAGCSGGTSPG